MNEKIFTKLTEHRVSLFEEGKTTKISGVMQLINEICKDFWSDPIYLLGQIQVLVGVVVMIMIYLTE